MKYLFVLLIILNTFFLMSQENINAKNDSPLFSSYIADYKNSNYFVDEGYHLIYYKSNKPLSLKNESSGNIEFGFKLGNILVYDLNDYYKKPIIKASFPDSFILEAEPFAGLKIKITFLLPKSNEFYIKIKSINNTKRNFYIYFIYNNNYQNINIVNFDKKGTITIKYKEPSKGVYFQQDSLKGFNENRISSFGFSKFPYSWGGFKTNLIKGQSLVKNELFLNGSINGVLKSFVINFKINKKNDEIILVKSTSQSKDINANILNLKSLLKLDKSDFLNKSKKIIDSIPELIFLNENEKYLYYAGLFLVYQQFYPPKKRFKYPYYVFSREPTWGWGHEGQVFHESLSMHSLILFKPKLAIGSQLNFTIVQEKDGYIPYRVGDFFTRTFPANGEKTTSAPYFNWTNLELYKTALKLKNVDKEYLKIFLEKSYKSGKRFVNYLYKTRDKNKNGLFEWGGNTLLECVRDYLNAVFDLLGKEPETLNQLEALDLSCMVAKEVLSLKEMAKILGYKKETKYWNDKYLNLKRLINKYMWDEETGFYYHVHKDTMTFNTPDKKSLKRKEIIGFLPIWAGISDKVRTEKLLIHLKNPDEFWREFGIPTLSAADPYYDAQVLSCCRWNGPVWITWVYPVFKGLLDYGYKDIAEELLIKMEKAMIFQLKRNHRMWESFSPDYTQLYSPKNYIWDSLISRMIYDMRSIK